MLIVVIVGERRAHVSDGQRYYCRCSFTLYKRSSCTVLLLHLYGNHNHVYMVHATNDWWDRNRRYAQTCNRAVIRFRERRAFDCFKLLLSQIFTVVSIAVESLFDNRKFFSSVRLSRASVFFSFFCVILFAYYRLWNYVTNKIELRW